MAPVSKHEGAASLWPSFETRRCRAAPQDEERGMLIAYGTHPSNGPEQR